MTKGYVLQTSTHAPKIGSHILLCDTGILSASGTSGRNRHGGCNGVSGQRYEYLAPKCGHGIETDRVGRPVIPAKTEFSSRYGRTSNLHTRATDILYQYQPTVV